MVNNRFEPVNTGFDGLQITGSPFVRLIQLVAVQILLLFSGQIIK
ncbi:hypothetical protein SAMN05216301_0246 [Morganella morganii]|nr:hypothetical protein SAMN05216301_0246 [Morganella morganii]